MDALMTLTNDDETNLIVCRIAKKNYGIPFIVARVNQPENLSLMKEAGADITICPSIETAFSVFERYRKSNYCNSL